MKCARIQTALSIHTCACICIYTSTITSTQLFINVKKKLISLRTVLRMIDKIVRQKRLIPNFLSLEIIWRGTALSLMPNGRETVVLRTRCNATCTYSLHPACTSCTYNLHILVASCTYILHIQPAHTRCNRIRVTLVS